MVWVIFTSFSLPRLAVFFWKCNKSTLVGVFNNRKVINEKKHKLLGCCSLHFPKGFGWIPQKKTEWKPIRFQLLLPKSNKLNLIHDTLCQPIRNCLRASYLTLLVRRFPHLWSSELLIVARETRHWSESLPTKALLFAIDDCWHMHSSPSKILSNQVLAGWRDWLIFTDPFVQIYIIYVYKNMYKQICFMYINTRTNID